MTHCGDLVIKVPRQMVVAMAKEENKSLCDENV